MRFKLSCLALTLVAHAARIKIEKMFAENISTASSGTAIRLQEGDIFMNRFELVNFIGACAYKLVEDAKPNVPFPEKNMGARFCTCTRFWSNDNPEFLGSGSFGETWRVRDKQAEPGSQLHGKDLALKLFYIRDRQGNSYHIWPKMLKAYPVLKERYDETVKECTIAKTIQKQVGGSPTAPNGNPLDVSDLFADQDTYLNHKCCCPNSDGHCKLRHVKLGSHKGCGSIIGSGWHSHLRHGSTGFFKNRTRSAGCVVGEEQDTLAKTLRKSAIMASLFMKCYEHGDNPAYVLLSYGGSQTMSDYLRSWSPSMQSTGILLKQMLQGLQVLSWVQPPLIHHDLKSDNIVVRDVDGLPRLTIIDFGGMQQYTSKQSEDSGVSSMHISAPEWQNGKAYEFCGPTVSDLPGFVDKIFSLTRGQPCNQAFDIYSVGNILAEILTTATINLWLHHPMAGVSVQVQETSVSESQQLLPLLAKYVKNGLASMLPTHDQRPAIFQIDAPAMAFFTTYLPRMVAFRAKDRPTASDMLNSKWLAGMPDNFASS